MKILLAPSESKRSGGKGRFRRNALLFEEEHELRNDILDAYQALIDQGDEATLAKLFGLKKPNDIARYRIGLDEAPVMPAIRRYDGVAFDYLDVETLPKEAQDYLDEHLILFSNLFGPLRASDPIPEYKLKQGAHIGDIAPERYYKERTQTLLDAMMRDEEILDLRAGFYDKFYKPTRPYTTLKFVKNGKVVSHWAKAYRGLVLRAVAQVGVDTLESFMKLPIEGLEIAEIQTKGHKTEIVYTIIA